MASYGTTRAGIITSGGSQTLTLKTDESGTTALTIDASGNVGIGTSTSDGKVNINGDASDSNLILHLENRTAQVNGYSDHYFYPDLYIIRNSSGINKVLLDSDGDSYLNGGNVGIGTDSPLASTRLHVYETVATDAVIAIGTRVTPGTSIGKLQFLHNSATLNGQGGYIASVPEDTYAYTANADSSLKFATSLNNAETVQMTIDSSGNVGIGVTPTEIFQVGGSVNPVFDILESGTTGTCRINFSDSGASARGQIYYDHTNDYMRLLVAGAEAMRIDSSGNVDISTGNLVIGTSGKGIDFSANTDDETGSGSIDSGGEVLDDYEEGTWTPTMVFATTQGDGSTAGTGYYTKIGNLVHVNYTGTFSHSTSVGVMTLTGLPFTVNANAGGALALSLSGIGVSTGTQIVVSDFLINSTTVRFFRKIQGTSSSVALEHSYMAASGSMVISGFYRV